MVPDIDAGAHAVTVKLGDVTSTATFTVDQGVATPPPPFSIPTATGVRPLGSNLKRLFNFSNATKRWAFYDPLPAFAEVNTVTRLFPGEIYWIWVKEDQTVTLDLKERNLAKGWNIISW